MCVAHGAQRWSYFARIRPAAEPSFRSSASGFPETSSTGQVPDRVGVAGVVLELFDGFNGRHYAQLDIAAPSFALHLVHDRQGTASRADYQKLAVPRNFSSSTDTGVWPNS